MIRITTLFIAALFTSWMVGCSVFGFIAAGKQAVEDQMLVETPATYSLEGYKVAVVIDTDLAIHYEHPGVSTLIAEAIAGRIAKNVPNVSVVRPNSVARWQFDTPQWTAMPSSEIARSLSVDRVVYVELQNYSLTPPGNHWLWEGRCSAMIGIIEANNSELDGFADTYEISASFPDRPSILHREEASEATIEQGLLNEFIRNASWLFYLHNQPKYPDRYRAELNQ